MTMPMLSDQTLAYGEEIAAALLGVDALYRTESGDQEGLAVVDLSCGTLKAEPFDGYPAARQRWEGLKAQAGGLPEPDRRVYYDQLADSTLAFIQWRQGGLPFRQQLANFLHVPAEPVSEAELDGLQAQMRGLLNQMGYNGSLVEQFEAWEARQRVPPDEVPGLISELLDQAWNRTEELLHIPADKSDGMRVAPVSGMAFNARCNYRKREIELNIDPVLTRPGLKHLAVHEGCPGHYVQFKLRETLYKEGLAPADGLLSVVNTASSSTFEGIADNGLQMIGWLETDDDRLQALLGRYRAGIGTGAAWRLHALGWNTGQVTDWLRERTLAGGEGWVAGRMRFLAAPARAVLIWSYWWGEAVVSPAYRQASSERRPEFLRYLYGRMHSNRTVAMFQ